MNHILVYGKEHTFLDKDTELLFRNSSIHQTASLHTHTFYEIFAVAEGTALHMVNNSISFLSKGDLVFIRPEDVHTYEFYYSSDFRIINIGFSRTIFQSIQILFDYFVGFKSLLSNEMPPLRHLNSDELNELCFHFLNIGSYIQDKNPTFTSFYTRAYLATVFTKYFFRYDTANTSVATMPSWFNNMLREMQKIENLQAGMPRMLELSLCSPNHLCRCFKKAMSQTPIQYINKKRLEYAVYLLTQTENDILFVCNACGFNNLSHFYHLFKQEYRMTPLQFRKKHLNA